MFIKYFQRKVFSRINTNIECAVIWYLHSKTKFLFFFSNFLLVYHPIECVKWLYFLLLSSKIGKDNFVRIESEDNSVFARDFPALSSSCFDVELRGILNLANATCKFSRVFILISVYTSLDKVLFNDLCGGFLKDKISYLCKRRVISLRPHDSTIELRLGWC